MGLHVSGGKHNDIYTTNCGWMVMEWVTMFERVGYRDDLPMDEWVGVVDHTPEAVCKANEAVPDTMEEAKAKGFIPQPGYRGPISQEDFDKGRAFLRRAAELGAGLGGSY